MIDIINQNADAIIGIMKKSAKLSLELQKLQTKSTTKENGSIVSEADTIVNDYICNSIKDIFGNVKIISEEHYKASDANIVNDDDFFLIDPIDGTQSFLAHNEYSINLAFCHKNQPIMSLIADPLNDRILYYDNCSEKSFSIENNKISEINTNKTVSNINTNNVKIVMSTTSDTDFDNKIIESLKTNTIFNISKIETNKGGLSKSVEFVLNRNFADIGIIKKCHDWDFIPILPILQNSGIHCEYIGSNVKVQANIKPNMLQYPIIFSRNLEELREIKNNIKTFNNEIIV